MSIETELLEVMALVNRGGLLANRQAGRFVLTSGDMILRKLAELEACRADGERWQHIRTRIAITELRLILGREDDSGYGYCEDVDAEIDAARAQLDAVITQGLADEPRDGKSYKTAAELGEALRSPK